MIVFAPGLGLALVRRRYPPLGWALPGGFVDYGETVERAAVRETLEETSLHVDIKGLVGVYSDPARDPRKHTISTVFWGQAADPEQIKGGDDAREAKFFQFEALPDPIVFDHRLIIEDFRTLHATGNTLGGSG
jgi:8-oxo-dGTP diphosphatase